MLISSNMKSLGRFADIHTVTVAYDLINYFNFTFITNYINKTICSILKRSFLNYNSNSN